ncbi:MAG: hypothetical protein ACP5UD_09555 [Conexivisphaera sp.]|jgi:hypothetical protein
MGLLRRIFHFTHVFIIAVPRIGMEIKAMFTCAVFNLMRALFPLRTRQGT